MKQSALRSIPAVETILQSVRADLLPRPTLVRLIRDELAALRRQKKIPKPEAILGLIEQRVAAWQRARIQPVINGTGVIIHTNLGRSLLAEKAIERLVAVSSRIWNEASPCFARVKPLQSSIIAPPPSC
jgi:L-seryl-tRNA(Ser) seleniumtransferase